MVASVVWVELGWVSSNHVYLGTEVVVQYGHPVGWSWGGCVLIKFTLGLRLCRSMVTRVVWMELGWVCSNRLPGD